MSVKGFFDIVDGKFHNKSLDRCYASLAVVIDTGSGSVMKYGEIDEMREYYDLAVNTAKNLAITDMDSEISFIDISGVADNIGVVYACTFVNYLCSSVDRGLFKKLLVSDEDEMVAILERIHDEYDL